MDRLSAPLALLIGAWLLAVYLPGVGNGFVKDDFAWIAQSRLEAPRDVPRLFAKNTGFYRPLVSLSFSLDELLFGLRPFPYGLTNLLLLFLTGLSVARLARAFGLPTLGGVIAAGLWILNPHGINMAVLWVSGRTALLLTLFATLGASAFLKDRIWTAAGWTLLAMLSKEEAVLLPFVFVMWSLIEAYQPAPNDERSRQRRLLKTLCHGAALVLPLLVYAVLRSWSGAFTPSSAPPFYRFSSDWHLIGANVLAGLDRAATFGVAVALLSTLAARRIPGLGQQERRTITKAVAWMIGGYGLTLFLPVRSSLYACFPSVGAAVIAATWIVALARTAPRLSFAPVVSASVLVAIALVPVYWARNQRSIAPARLSTAVLAQLSSIMAVQAANSAILIRDRSDTRENIVGAFGTLLPEAVRLTSHREDVGVWVDPPPADWRLSGWTPPRPGTPLTVFVLRERTLVRVGTGIAGSRIE